MEKGHEIRHLDREESVQVAAELARSKLDLVGVEDVRWDKGATVRAGDFFFFFLKEAKIINWEQGFLYATEECQQFRE